jgi:hypothetical protein
METKVRGTDHAKESRATSSASPIESRIRYVMLAMLGEETYYVIRHHELLPLDRPAIEDQHFAAPARERPLWWWSRKGAERVGERLAAEHGWDGVEIVEISLPDFVGSGQRFPSRLETGPGARRYWALMANPERYRILDALDALDTDTWLVPTGNPTPGDRVAIWMAKGRGEHRGVAALGEVITSPEMMEEPAASGAYWVEAQAAGPSRCMTIRYVLPPGAPLWLEHDDEGVLTDLSVSRGQGTKLYKVTAAQWDRLVDALGGWPDDDGLLGSQAAQRSLTAVAADGLEENVAHGSGQGFSSSPERRKAIEDHAMKAAADHFASAGFRIEDTHANRPYDLVGRRDGRTLYIEVKGTTTAGEKVFLTRNEVEHARRHAADMALYVLHDIEVEGDWDSVAVSGGVPRILQPWDVEAGSLGALQFEYMLPVGEE